MHTTATATNTEADLATLTHGSPGEFTRQSRGSRDSAQSTDDLVPPRSWLMAEEDSDDSDIDVSYRDELRISKKGRPRWRRQLRRCTRSSRGWLALIAGVTVAVAVVHK